MFFFPSFKVRQVGIWNCPAEIGKFATSWFDSKLCSSRSSDIYILMFYAKDWEMWRTRLQVDEYLFIDERLLLHIPSQETWKKY